MEIYFLRHASAGEPKLNPAKDDERPLDKLGIEQSHNVGRLLAALNVKIDAIITSSILRATQTAEIVAQAIGHQDKLINDEVLLSGAAFDDFQDLLRRHNSEKAIMVVGHNPSLTEFLNKLLFGETATDAMELKKGAIAKVEKGAGHAVLKWYMPPKVVRAIQQASAKSSRANTVSK